MQPFQTFAKDVFKWAVGPQRSVNRDLTVHFSNADLFTYLLEVQLHRRLRRLTLTPTKRS